MTYTPKAKTLGGVPYGVAACFGMPHIGAYYLHDNADSNKLEHGAFCAVCGRPANNSHHEPPKGAGGRYRQFTMYSDWGMFILKPALVALCGSGTTGCHGARHNGNFRIEWEWFDDTYAEQWWSGYLLSHGYVPHDPKLYELGQWRITSGGGVEITFCGAQGVAA